MLMKLWLMEEEVMTDQLMEMVEEVSVDQDQFDVD